jgi:hypothetical protein
MVPRVTYVRFNKSMCPVIYICDYFHCKASSINAEGSGRMASSGMLRLVALVRSDVSEERIASIIMVERTSKIGATLTVTNN